MNLHITNVFLSEELENMGIPRDELLDRLHAQETNHPWKRVGDWVVLSRECALELYPHLNLPEGMDDPLELGKEFDDYLPFKEIQKSGFSEEAEKAKLDHLPDDGFAIFTVDSLAKRFPDHTGKGYVYVITPEFIDIFYKRPKQKKEI